jgi:hypothetical protein
VPQVFACGELSPHRALRVQAIARLNPNCG